MTKTKSPALTVNKVTANVLNIELDVPSAPGWEQWFLLSSDRHHDSADCDRALELRHLEKARALGARVLDFGDMFDAMQGKYDPRRNYPEMRPEYVKAMADTRKGYFDVIVADAVDFYAPFADLFALVTVGNHETGVSKHSDVNLTDAFVYGLNAAAGSSCAKGAYGGWVVFRVTYSGTRKMTRRLKYFHGAGGGGQVNKGVQVAPRQAVFVPDAHVVVNGHIHESWILALKRERITDQGRIYQDLQYHVRTPTYKDEYGDGSHGWDVERGQPPKPRGAVWMRLTVDADDMRVDFQQDLT